MNVVFGLVGVTVVLLMVIVMVMLWAIRSGQFEDMEGPAWRIVMDDDRADPNAGNGTHPGGAAGDTKEHVSPGTTDDVHGTRRDEQTSKEH